MTRPLRQSSRGRPGTIPLVHKIRVAERRARLARRHRLAPGHRAGDVVEAAASMVCLHGTDPGTVYLSAHARVEEMTVADLDRALYADRSLVKHMAMRRTLFVFPRETLPVAQAGASLRVADAERRRLIRDVEKAGLRPDGKRWLAQVSKQVLTALADGRRGHVVAAARGDPAPPGLDHLRRGQVLGRSGGDRPPGDDRAVGRRADRARVQRRRLDHFAAALGGDTVMAGRADRATARSRGRGRASSSAGCGPSAPARRSTSSGGWDRPWAPCARRWPTLEAVEVDLDGQTGYLLPDDLEATDPVEPWAALLPPLDPTTMGWSQRDWYLGPHKAQLFDTNGNAGPTLWWEGRIVGGWRQSDSGEVVLQVLDDIGADGVQALEREAARLTDWLEGAHVPAPLPVAAV